MLYPNPQRFDHLRCFFVHCPKVAGTSIEKTLAAPDQTVGGHSTAAAMRHKWPQEWEDYFTFSVVRDPVSRFLSAYSYLTGHANHPALMNDRVKAFPSLEAFVESFEGDKVLQNIVHFMPQHEFICDRHGSILVDYVAKYEDLEKEWRYICRVLGVTLTLPRLNLSKQTFYPTSQVKEMVKRVFAQDFSLFYQKSCREVLSMAT